MDIISLANSIQSLALAHYVPFSGFDEAKITEKAKKHLDVTDYEISVALEYLCQR